MGVLIKILRSLVEVASPELKKILEDWVLEFEEKAEQTDNPWDDILAALLKAILID